MTKTLVSDIIQIIILNIDISISPAHKIRRL